MGHQPVGKGRAATRVADDKDWAFDLLLPEIWKKQIIQFTAEPDEGAQDQKKAGEYGNKKQMTGGDIFRSNGLSPACKKGLMIKVHRSMKKSSVICCLEKVKAERL